MGEKPKFIKVKPATHDLLTHLGHKGETYSNTINRLMDFYINNNKDYTKKTREGDSNERSN